MTWTNDIPADHRLLDSRIKLIKAVRVCSGMGLKEAKDLVDEFFKAIIDHAYANPQAVINRAIAVGQDDQNHSVESRLAKMHQILGEWVAHREASWRDEQERKAERAERHQVNPIQEEANFIKMMPTTPAPKVVSSVQQAWDEYLRMGASAPGVPLVSGQLDKPAYRVGQYSDVEDRFVIAINNYGDPIWGEYDELPEANQRAEPTYREFDEDGTAPFLGYFVD